MLAAEKMDALAAMRASKLSAERAHAMDYYNGDMSRDMPTQDGRSRAVSTDVADTIDGLMPSLMEIFAGSDDVVRFEAFGPEDVAAAEQETDYVNHVFMQQNPGFLILYSFIKDALLSKVGIVKVWWEEREEEQRETYLDQPDDAFALLVANPDIEIVAHSARPDPSYRSAAPPPQPLAGGLAAQLGAGAEEVPPAAPTPAGPPEPEDDGPVPMLHDVTVVTRKTVAQARVEGVPPEEFGISRFARSLRDCGYCFHEVIKREEDLIADGYDRDEIEAIPTYAMLTNPEELARDTVDEHLSAGGGEGINEVNRQIKITEHYVRMDYEGNNKPALYRVTTGGDQGEVLTAPASAYLNAANTAHGLPLQNLAQYQSLLTPLAQLGSQTLGMGQSTTTQSVPPWQQIAGGAIGGLGLLGALGGLPTGGLFGGLGNMLGGYNPDGSMSGNQWLQAGQGLGPYRAG
jgi:hypothetical protein